MHKTQVRSLGREDPLEEEMESTLVFLSGKSHGQSSLVGYSPRGQKELDMTTTGMIHLSDFQKPSNWVGWRTKLGSGRIFFFFLIEV